MSLYIRSISTLKQIVELAQQRESNIQQLKAIFEANQHESHRGQVELNQAFEAVNRKLSIYDSIQKGTISPEREFRMGGKDGLDR